jgi:hypothetical protein
MTRLFAGSTTRNSTILRTATIIYMSPLRNCWHIRLQRCSCRHRSSSII